MIKSIVCIIIMSGFSIVTIYFMIKAFILDMKERRKLDILFLLFVVSIIICNISLLYKVWTN